MKNELSFDDVDSLLSQHAEFKKELHSLMKMTSDEDVLGLSMMQFHLLNMIEKRVQCNQKELANNLHISKATLSVRIDRLVNMNLVDKVVDVNDKRNFILELTSIGKEKLLEGRHIVRSSVLPVLEGVTKEELIAVKSFIYKLENNIKKMKEDL